MRRIFNIASVACLITGSLTVLIVGWLNPVLPEPGLLLFFLYYFCAFIPLSLLSSLWLVWTNRRYLSNPFIWMAFQLLFAISMALYFAPVVNLLILACFLILLFPLLGLVNFLHASQTRTSLRFIGWGSAGLVWFILIAWKITGNIFIAWVKDVGTGTNNLWWFLALLIGFVWMILAGIAAFFVQAFQIIKKEFLLP